MKDQNKKQFIDDAKEIIRGKSIQLPALKKLVKKLESGKYYSLAREVLETVLEEPGKKDGELMQWLAKRTYKDPGLPNDVKFDKAIEILELAFDLDETTDQETLGLLGAIYKRKWQYYGQPQYLRFSLHFYERGYLEWLKLVEAGGDAGDGYTAINTAFMFDLIAYNVIEDGKEVNTGFEEARSYIGKSREIRKNIIEYVKPIPGNYWVYATLAEANFGLRQFEKAEALLVEAGEMIGDSNEQFESTSMQMVTLADLLVLFEEDESKKAAILKSARKTLESFLKKDVDAIDSAFTGKVGLALSGGGFRASLFHIGVLAKLAELDILRHVQVLSCVSGGSIIGAYYYLEVKKILESKKDHRDQNDGSPELSKKDYIDVVKRIEKEFLAGVQKNLRMRVFSNFFKNLRIFFSSSYNRTYRLGELYEEVLYQPVVKGTKMEGKPIAMKDLIIQPKGEEDFNLKRDNWRRKHKVPVLVLNATSMNTGHNWQFTSSWMGEPPGNIVSEVDSKYRLRRLYYGDAPTGHYQNFRLGYAVAASSCVPGLFDPLPMDGLYENIDLQLVDGGVHDNQGIAGLLEQECKVIFVSDASGQLNTEDLAGQSPLSVLARTNNILMERVRECGFLDLKNRKDTRLVKAMSYIHLKRELEAEPKSWINCQDTVEKDSVKGKLKREKDLTSYGVRKKIQEQLSGIRTDLDSFNEVEAYALMYSAYQMTDLDYNENMKTVFKQPENYQSEDWDFLKVKAYVTDAKKEQSIHHLMEAAQELLFKVFKLSIPWRMAGIAFGGLLFLLLAWGAWFIWNHETVILQKIAVVLTFLIIAILLVKVIARVFNYEGKLGKFIAGSFLSIVLFLAFNFYLTFLNKTYLKKGEMKNLP
ncbi:MAG: patatin-like phospholipase family protein [Bacteroidota bacterium]